MVTRALSSRVARESHRVRKWQRRTLTHTPVKRSAHCSCPPFASILKRGV